MTNTYVYDDFFKVCVDMGQFLYYSFFEVVNFRDSISLMLTFSNKNDYIYH